MTRGGGVGRVIMGRGGERRGMVIRCEKRSGKLGMWRENCNFAVRGRLLKVGV